MLEKHRLTYLDSLGIENYMPRFQLPHALPSQLLSNEALQEPAAFSTVDLPAALPKELTAELSAPTEASITEESETLLSNVKSQDDSSVQTAPVVDSLMASLGIQREEIQVKPLAESTVPPIIATINSDVIIDVNPRDTANISTSGSGNGAVSTTKVIAGQDTVKVEIRFTLNVWRIREELMVIDSRQPAAALPTEKLLQNILRSVGYPLAQLPPSELLRWPLFTNKKLTSKNLTNKYIDQSSEEEEARAMVQAYLSAQYAKAPVKTLLLLGQSAVQFALTPNTEIKDFYEQHKGSQITSSPWQSQVLVAPSLVDMLHDPMQKRVTWQALQVLLHSQAS
jgi:hypothetical protein